MADILAALAATPEGTAGQRCKVGRWLDTIPADEPGRDELVAAFEAEPRTARSNPQLAGIAAHLGHPISERTIGMHRAGACRCSW